MCGVIGGFTYEPINRLLFNGLTMLQHRGQDGAGMATAVGDAVYMRRREGLVSEVFREARHLFPAARKYRFGACSLSYGRKRIFQ